MIFLSLLALPLITAALGFFLLHGITWKEFLLQVAAQMAVAGISVGILYYSNTADTEVWNGRVKEKTKDRVSCSHSYSCPPCWQRKRCSGTGKNRTCYYYTECSTCYEHSNDWSWRVRNTIGETWTISRVDRQGAQTPPRWAAVEVGEPTAELHSYENFIKAAPGTLFRRTGAAEKYAKLLPAYPRGVYDYWHINRLVLVNGAKVGDPKVWNDGLEVLNGTLGHDKQVNIVVVVAKDLPMPFFHALQQAWIGGKKNDAILVVSVDGAGKPRWARVMCWAKKSIFNIELRDAVMALPTLDAGRTLALLEKYVRERYERRPMHDFEYLKSSVTPTPFQMSLAMFIGLLVAGVLLWVFHRHDVFGDEGR